MCCLIISYPKEVMFFLSLVVFLFVRLLALLPHWSCIDFDYIFWMAGAYAWGMSHSIFVVMYRGMEHF